MADGDAKTVYELPPNGQGIAKLQMPNILKSFDLQAMGHNTAAYLHVQAEAKKLTFEDRARFYADPAFADVPLEGLSLERLRRRAPRPHLDGQHTHRRPFLSFSTMGGTMQP
ncbi:MAG: gamma-glutamyltransferase [Rhodothermales bacterium]